MGMLYTLNSMFKLRVHILFFLSLLAASQEVVDFKYIEAHEKNLKDQLVNEYKLLHNTWLFCLLYTSPSPRDAHESRMPSSA